MSNKLKVIKVSSDEIEFNDGTRLFSSHEQDCCEHHELTLDDLTLKDFDGLVFDLSNDGFFKEIPEFGIELLPIKGHSIRIPGHGYNNGYYSSELTLVVEFPDKTTKRYNITDCQVITG